MSFQQGNVWCLKPTIIGGEEGGVVQVILNIRRLSVQNSDGGDAAVVRVDSQPVSRVGEF